MGVLIIFNAIIFLPKFIELKILKKMILFSAKYADFFYQIRKKSPQTTRKYIPFCREFYADSETVQYMV